MEEESLLCSEEGGSAFEACARLVGGLIGGNDAFDVYCEALAVAVNEAEAYGRDLAVSVGAGDHLYGNCGAKIGIYHNASYREVVYTSTFPKTASLLSSVIGIG